MSTVKTSSSPSIAVLGGGPAGAATAIGLARMGYAVILFNTPRRFAAVEGVSDRVAQGLQQAGLEQALATLAPPSPRRVMWGGKESAVNTERLIYRPDFDAALLRDAASHGVEWRDAWVDGWKVEDSGRIAIDFQTTDEAAARLFVDFVVEARGRAAPLSANRVRGVETVSLLQYWHPTTPGEEKAHSAVQSFAAGWAWLAMGTDGRRYLQLTLDVATANLPEKARLGDFCREHLARLELAHAFTAGAEPEGELHARACTPILASGITDQHCIRVGDAAAAGDPLSGNGIFLALSSALQAPAVIHTLLQHPERGVLARDFHFQRLTGLFYRFARIGRDFYAKEDQWPNAPFWQTRRAWPDAEPLHRALTPESVHLARRPVLSHGEIIEAEVVVTPDNPLGIWLLDGIELAPALALVRAVKTAKAARQALAAYLGEPENEVPRNAERLLAWFEEQGWIDFGNAS
ncbi:MAG: FAD-dependent oxidoreductase [Azoarcus sp.]|jgi:flavin-dependent dehydrogenase|nr:FAD-dependent oxidoreductase [Azoarcus sp.]